MKVHSSSHDKIEFDLFPTCFSFQVKKKLRDLGYKKNHHDIENKLLQIFLANLKDKSYGSIKYNLNKIEILNKIQKNNIYNKKFNVLSIKRIIKDLKKYGIIPFSILARHGFVAKDLLISLKDINILSETDINMVKDTFFTLTNLYGPKYLSILVESFCISSFETSIDQIYYGLIEGKTSNEYKMNVGRQLTLILMKS